MNTASPMTALKGVGDKTAALFHRVGVDTVGELLSYYPRTYDTYEKPVTFANLETDRVQAVTGFARRTPDSKKAGRLTVTTLTLEEFGMYLHLGQNTVVDTDQLLGVFDLDISGAGSRRKRAVS